ncbi:MAG: preprotein translocase subunit SecG [Ignavibacteriaceae bacterium]|nr:preprotein translocase subunit SecG [Ignavibacteriaceae bacterium]
MYTFLVVLASIISVFLMVVVLMQSSKGDGLSGTFGGAAGSMGTMFGTRRTADFLSKGTWWLAGSLAILAIAINLFFLPGQAAASQKESIIQRSGRQQIPQTPTLPSESQSVPAQQGAQPKK